RRARRRARSRRSVHGQAQAVPSAGAAGRFVPVVHFGRCGLVLFGVGMTQLLDLTAGALLLTAVLILWRRELAVIVRVFAVQGVTLGALVAVLAAQEHTVERWASAAGIVILRAGLLPA